MFQNVLHFTTVSPLLEEQHLEGSRNNQFTDWRWFVAGKEENGAVFWLTCRPNCFSFDGLIGPEM
jgi:hypothetical protein